MKNKVFLITLAFMLFLLFAVITTPVSANGDNKIGDTNVTVEALTGGNIDVNGNTATITLSANDVNNIEWHPAKEDEIERPANGWWIGFKLKFDESVKDKNVQSTYTNYLGKQQGPEPIVFDSVGGTDYSCWIAVNENVINALKKDTSKTFATFNFTCDDPTMKFDVIVKISDPGSVQLKEDTNNAVKITVKDVIFTMKKGKSLDEGLTDKEKTELNKLMTPDSGYKFVGLFDKENKKVELTTQISKDTTLTPKFEKIPSSSGSSTPNVDNIVVEEVNKTDDKAMGGTSSSAEKDVIIETLKEELKNNKELASKLAGKSTEINVEFSDANSSVASEVKTKMEEAAKKVADNLKIDAFYNIEVAVLANNIKVGNLKELTKPIELKLSMPEGLGEVAKGYTRKYYVIREHDGEVTVLDTNVSENGKYITFKTDKFSTYALAYKDEKIDNSNNSANLDNTPKTGDLIIPAVITLLVSSVAICLWCVTRMKH